MKIFSNILPEKLTMKNIFKASGIFSDKKLLIKTNTMNIRKVNSFKIWIIMIFFSNYTNILNTLISIFVEDNKNTIINGYIPLIKLITVSDLIKKIMISY